MENRHQRVNLKLISNRFITLEKELFALDVITPHSNHSTSNRSFLAVDTRDFDEIEI